MRIKNQDDISKLGPRAKKQIESALKQQGGFHNQKRATRPSELSAPQQSKSRQTERTESRPATTRKKKAKPSRVMSTAEGFSYCPWPSPDPFVAVIQRLEAKYGMYDDGGLLLTELIIDGGAKNWRFDIALLSPFREIDVSGRPMHIGYTCLVEADGFGFHRSKDAFKNDRAKQTHALKQGFALKRITNEDARSRLDAVIDDIDTILSQPRLYNSPYRIYAKGKTQCFLRWLTHDENV